MLKIYSIIFFLFSFFGFLDTMYLTVSHYKNSIPPCSIAHGCEIVLTSQFATVSGIPISLFGVLFYILIIFFLFFYLQTKNKNFLFFLFVIITIGTIISTYLVVIQAVVLHAFCQYCMISDSITIFLFISFLLLRRKCIKS